MGNVPEPCDNGAAALLHQWGKLLERRVELLAQLAEVEAGLTAGAEAVAPLLAEVRSLSRRSYRPVDGGFRAITTAFLADRVEHAVAEIIEHAANSGVNATEPAMRSMLSKMLTDGLVERTARGTYKWV